MDSFVTVLVICLIGGLAFLLGSLVVVSRLPRTQTTGGTTTVKIRDWTFSTTDVYVGVTFLSAALAATIPLFAMWLNSRIDDVPVMLSVSLPAGTSDQLSFTYDHDSVLNGGVYSFPVFKSSRPQGFAVTKTSNPNKPWLNVSARYAWLDKTVHVKVDNVDHPLHPSGGGVDVPLQFASQGLLPAVAQIQRAPGTAPPVPAAAAAIPDPILRSP